jgi:hypothetical protein
MKTLLKISVTKVVLLLIVVCIIIIELYKTFKGWDLDQVFIDITLMVISFYFWQKGMVYESVDSLEKDLDSNTKI